MEELPVVEEKKYHDFKKLVKNKYVLAILFVFFVFVGPIFTYFYYDFAINRPAQFGKETTFDIESGEPLSVISKRLYSEGLVNSEFLFRVYLILNGYEGSIQAGSYEVPDGASIVELARLLQHGVDSKNITFIEGWRVEQFAKKASDTFDKVDYEDFVLSARNDEGYLFPDTYNFNSDVDEEEIVKTLKATFDSRTEGLFTEEKLAKTGLTKEQVIVLASIVEREVLDEQSRKIVAGILLKRYRDGVMLGADATTQYVAAPRRYGCPEEIVPNEVCPNQEIIPNVIWWPHDLTQAELDMESPYNTRKVVGLPPKPISSVSVSAIEAVLDYEDTPYYFYITGNDGVTYYAETYDQHQQNIYNHLR